MATFMAMARLRPSIRNVKHFNFKQCGLDTSYFIGFTGKRVNSPIVLYASLHTQRQVVQHIPQLSKCILKGQSQRQSFIGASLVGVRWNSSANSDAPDSILPPGYTPYAPALPDGPAAAPEVVSSVSEGLNALGEPTLASLGLGSCWPPGLVQQALEALHVSAGLPWWGAIVAFTISYKLLMFPSVVWCRREAILRRNHELTVQRLQQQLTEARQRGDKIATMQYDAELSDYMKRNEIKPFARNLIPFCVFVTIYISPMWGLYKMAKHPVESMTTGGTLWFPDLTVSDYFYGLPLLTSLIFLLSLEVFVVNGKKLSYQTDKVEWFERAIPIIIWPVLSYLYCAELVYVFTLYTITGAEVLFLALPAVRKTLKLPKPIEHSVVKQEQKTFVQGSKKAGATKGQPGGD